MCLKLFLLLFIPFSLFAASPLPVASPQWKLPTVEFRDRMLAKAGLNPAVSGWGSLEKDQLYSTARDSSLADLIKKYPSLSQNHLKNLSRISKAGEKDKSPHVEGQPKADPDDVIDKVVHIGP